MESKRQVDRQLMIDCGHISKTFVTKSTQTEVVKDFSLKVYENEFVTLFGPGQCGKTTILNLLAGLVPISSGELTIEGEKVVGPSPRRGMVFQTTALFPWLTAWQNVEFGPKVLGVKKSERKKRVQHYIDLVGLTGFENALPVKLSGGMQQRVGIARSYCNNPSVILMDEPFGHLDAQTRYMMEEELVKICSKEMRTVVFVTNNIEEAIYLSDRIILLDACPTSNVREYTVDFSKPRDYTAPDFLELRERITRDINELVRLDAE